VTTGKIGEYFWAQHWERTSDLVISDIVRTLRAHIVGRRAVNVSWDSGRLSPPLSGPFERWQTQDGFVITPPIDDALISNWPRSACGFDEWYFFRSIPETIFLQAFCSWAGMTLGDWRELEFTGMNLEQQLVTHEPELVVAEGYSIFVIARRQDVLNDFISLVNQP
jgi:hypothetical protein